MNIREMRDALDHHCDTHELCEGCQYVSDNNWWCYSYCDVWDIPDKCVPNFYNKLCEPTFTKDDVKEVEDVVNHPNHYTNGGMECIDEMILVFGKDVVSHFCLCNAWKYRYRALSKNGEEDIKKSHWYMNKYKELHNHANTPF